MNQWKNWLRSHYQYKYNLWPIRWSKLKPWKLPSESLLYENRNLAKSKRTQPQRRGIIGYKKNRCFIIGKLWEKDRSIQKDSNSPKARLISKCFDFQMRFRSCSLYKLIPNTNKCFFLLKILNPGEVFAACLEKDELNLTLLQL